MILSMRAWSLGLLVVAFAVPASAGADEPVEPFPPDAVALVDDTVITREAFDRWFAVLSKATEPDRPAEHRAAVREVMTFLIQSEWVLGEARLQGVRVSDRRVRRELEHQKDAAFPTERAYRRWLRRSGMTAEMVLFR